MVRAAPRGAKDGLELLVRLLGLEVALRRPLVLDEPFAHLDAASRDAGFALLEQALADCDTAVLMVTHRDEEATRLGGATLASGRVSSRGGGRTASTARRSSASSSHQTTVPLGSTLRRYSQNCSR